MTLNELKLYNASVQLDPLNDEDIEAWWRALENVKRDGGFIRATQLQRLTPDQRVFAESVERSAVARTRERKRRNG